jgi:ATP-dependent DNA helicase RecG
MNEIQLASLLESLIALPKEKEWVEFKVNNSMPEEIGEYISALANSAQLHGEAHAYLVFGVEDSTHDIIGTAFRPSTEKVGNEEIENWLSVKLSPKVDFRIYEFSYHGKPVALFLIDSAFNVPIRFKNEAYIRVGSYKKKLKDHPEKERKIWAENTPVSFEKNVAAAGLSTDNVLRLLDYPAFFELFRRPLPAGKLGVIESLLEERVLISEGKSYSITNVGALLFAKRLDAFEDLAGKAVRLIFYKGDNKLETENEILGKRGYAVGFEGLIAYINDRLPRNEVIGQALRTEVKMFPDIAIRELVANALVHQDLTQSGTSPLVEVYTNRIEITNNGRPLIDPLRFLDEVPRSRNEVLAGLMRKLGICEERGSGIDKVIASAELYQLPPPDFIEKTTHTTVVLYSPRPLREMTRNEKIRACYQHACLKYVSNDQMTNATLRDRFKIEPQNYSIASRIIADTIEATLIKDYDPDSKSKRHAKYIPFWAQP